MNWTLICLTPRKPSEGRCVIGGDELPVKGKARKGDLKTQIKMNQLRNCQCDDWDW